MANNWIDSQTAVTENRVFQISDYVTLTYADGTTDIATATRRLICTVPAYSLITRVFYHVVTDFDAATNDYLTVGSATDDDILVDDADVSSGSANTPIVAVVQTTTLPYYIAADTKIYASYVYSSTAPTAGEVQVAIEWVPWSAVEVKTTLVG